MSSVVSRYGNTHLGYLFMKSAPRIVLASAALAIGAECFGNGLIDVFWNSANKGVREPIQSRKGLKKSLDTNIHTQPFLAFQRLTNTDPNRSYTLTFNHFPSIEAMARLVEANQAQTTSCEPCGHHERDQRSETQRCLNNLLLNTLSYHLANWPYLP